MSFSNLKREVPREVGHSRALSRRERDEPDLVLHAEPPNEMAFGAVEGGPRNLPAAAGQVGDGIGRPNHAR